MLEHFIKQMRNHCDKGMSVPSGDSTTRALARKKELLRVVTQMEGSKEFENQRKKFAHHVEEFKEYHRLLKPEEHEPCRAVKVKTEE